MRNNEDFLHDNAFFGDDGENFEQVKLPELSEATPKKTAVRNILPMLLIFAVTALICVTMFVFGSRSEIPVELPISTEDSEEWKGAFAAREIYEECLEASVSLKVGKGSNVKYWSGVVLSSDGWIATDGLVIGDADEGRIFVTLNDGREYGADSILRDKDSGAAVLKISAEGLRAAEMSTRELQGGERAVAVSLGSDIIVGSVSSVGEELKVNIHTDTGTRGAPVFDNDGYLIGLSVGENDTKACGADTLAELLEDVKK